MYVTGTTQRMPNWAETLVHRTHCHEFRFGAVDFIATKPNGLFNYLCTYVAQIVTRQEDRESLHLGADCLKMDQGEPEDREHGLGVRDLNSFPGSPTDSRCDLGQVT